MNFGLSDNVGSMIMLLIVNNLSLVTKKKNGIRY